MSGVGSISFLEIKAWEDTTGNYLETWEVEALKALDMEYIKEVNSKD